MSSPFVFSIISFENRIDRDILNQVQDDERFLSSTLPHE